MASKEPTKIWHPWLQTTEPWERIHIDFAELGRGNYFCLVVDAFSKWPEIVRMKEITSKTTIEFLRSLFARYGLCKIVVTDNGRQFVSEEFEFFLKMNGIKHILSPPYHPATNGQVERYVQIFKSSVKKSLAESKRSINEALLMFLMQYRKMPNCTTGISPAKLFLNREIRTRVDLVLPKDKNKQRKGSEFKVARNFEIGDKVAIRNYNSDQKWKIGRIIKKLGPLIYLAQVGAQTMRRHVNQLRHTEVQDTHEEDGQNELAERTSNEFYDDRTGYQKSVNSNDGYGPERASTEIQGPD